MREPFSLDAMRDLARLARLAPDESALPALAEDVARLMDWIGVLAEAPLDDVEPLTALHGATLRLEADAPEPTPGAEAITRHAPDARDGLFRAARAID